MGWGFGCNRLYAQVVEFEVERRAVPEWAEDCFYFIIRHGWEALSERLDGFEMSEEDKLDFLERYGNPQALGEVGQWAFEGEKVVKFYGWNPHHFLCPSHFLPERLWGLAMVERA